MIISNTAFSVIVNESEFISTVHDIKLGILVFFSFVKMPPENNISVGCLSLYVSPVIIWRPVQGGPLPAKRQLDKSPLTLNGISSKEVGHMDMIQELILCKSIKNFTFSFSLFSRSYQSRLMKALKLKHSDHKQYCLKHVVPVCVPFSDALFSLQPPAHLGASSPCTHAAWSSAEEKEEH